MEAYIGWLLGIVASVIGWSFKLITDSKEEIKMLKYKCDELNKEIAKVDLNRDRITVVETRQDNTNETVKDIKAEIKLVNDSIGKMNDEQRNFQLTTLEILSTIKADLASIRKDN